MTTTYRQFIQAGAGAAALAVAPAIGVGFGGYKQSGYGWKGGSEHVDGFVYKKAVTINGD